MPDVAKTEIPQAIADCLSNLSPSEPVAVALSGGGDSIALLHMVLAQSGDRTVHALIVDHALREGSDIEAKHAEDLARDIGAVSLILTWQHDGVRSAIQERARLARYGLMGDACRKLSISTLLVGHTEDDQAETVAMRAENGSGWRGLAGISQQARAPIWPHLRGIDVQRPLLSTSRAALRSYCAQHSLEFFNDPSNENSDFQRVRIRKDLAQHPAKRAEMLKLGKETRQRRDAEDASVTAWLKTHAIWGDSAQVHFPHGALDTLPAPALADMLRAVSGSAMRADMHKVAKLAAHIQVLDFTPRTLGGAIISPDGDDILITRDPGAVLGRRGETPLSMALTPNVPSIWDGRFEVMTSEVRLTLAPLWPARAQLSKAVQSNFRRLHPSIRRTLPGFFDGNTLIAAPQLDFMPDSGDFTLIPISSERFS